MSEEIKEILNKLSNCIWEKDMEEITYKILYSNDVYKLLHYIINLQQEIEKLNDDKRGMLVQLYKANDDRDKVKQENERLKDDFKNDGIRDLIIERDGYLEQLEDYISRCEKAIETLHTLNDSLPLDIILSEIEHTESILQNGSDIK